MKQSCQSDENNKEEDEEDGPSRPTVNFGFTFLASRNAWPPSLPIVFAKIKMMKVVKCYRSKGESAPKRDVRDGLVRLHGLGQDLRAHSRNFTA